MKIYLYLQLYWKSNYFIMILVEPLKEDFRLKSSFKNSLCMFKLFKLSWTIKQQNSPY